MTPPVWVDRGDASLRRLLRAGTFDLRELDVSGFRRWLERVGERWQRDPVFAQRCRIRDLRLAHPRLVELEAELRRARAADRDSPVHGRLAEVERKLLDAGKAIAGLSGSLRRAGPERRPGLEEKLARFRALRNALSEEQEELTRGSSERREVLRVRAELEALRSATGLDREQAGLERLQREQGRGSGRSGGRFESVALEVTNQYLLPELGGGTIPTGTAVLHGVTLGAADTELDQVVVVRSGGPERTVKALALVEAKRNVNDLAHGFRRRQENLAWLTGDVARYDPDRFRTRTFPHGHFDRPVVHHQDGESFTLAPDSFTGFSLDPATGYRMRRLYLITRAGTLWGVSAAALSRIAHRVSTDLAWDPHDDGYLARLLSWAKSLAETLESPDVVRLYASHPELARQLVLVRSAPPE